MMTTDIEQLEQQIEQLIRAQLAECARRTMLAVQRGFAATAKPTGRRGELSARRAAGQRRSVDELDGLAERLAVAVSAKPGTTMEVLAAEVGVTVRELEALCHWVDEAGIDMIDPEQYLATVTAVGHEVRPMGLTVWLDELRRRHPQLAVGYFNPPRRKMVAAAARERQMPIYEYRCTERGARLERMQRTSDAALKTRESCDQRDELHAQGHGLVRDRLQVEAVRGRGREVGVGVVGVGRGEGGVEGLGDSGAKSESAPASGPAKASTSSD